MLKRNSSFMDKKQEGKKINQREKTDIYINTNYWTPRRITYYFSPPHILNYLTQNVTPLLSLSSLEYETSQPLKNSRLELKTHYTFSTVSEEQQIPTYSITTAKAILPHTLSVPAQQHTASSGLPNSG